MCSLNDGTWRLSAGMVAVAAAVVTLGPVPTAIQAVLLVVSGAAVASAIWVPWRMQERAALQAISRRPSAAPTWAYHINEHGVYPGPHTLSRLPPPERLLAAADEDALEDFDRRARRAARGVHEVWRCHHEGRVLDLHLEPGAYRGFVVGWTEDATDRYDATATTLRLVRGLPVAACIVDNEHRILAHSDAWAAAGQANEGERIDADWQPDPAAEMRGRLTRALQAETYDAFHLRVGGSPYDMQVAPVQIDGRMAALVIAAPRDAVEHLQRSLETTQARLSGIIDGCPIPIVLHDADGRALGWSPAATKMFGWTAADAIGQQVPAPAPGHGDPQDWNRRALKRTILGERVLRADKDGHLVSVEAYTAPTRNENGTPVGFVALYLDPSDREQAQRQAEEIEELRGADALKTTFLSTAAHELGTPLTPLKLQLKTLRYTATEQQKSGFEMLERNVLRMERLVRDILDAAKLESRRLAIEKREVDVADVVRGVEEIFSETAKEKGVRLQSQAEPAIIEGDAIRLDQVLTNLVSNALKFTPEGGEIQVSSQATGSGVVLRVRDTGAGMTPEQVKDVFGAFTQFHRKETGAHIGTGLGMFISKGIVQAHGGRIECQSTPGAGTTFSIHLPRRHAGGIEGAALDVRR